MKKRNVLLCAAWMVSLLPLGCAVGVEGPEGDASDVIFEKSEAVTLPDGLSCSGTSCGTSPNPLGDNLDQAVSWNPCNGAPFTWQGEFNFEEGYDHITVGGQQFSGESVVASGHAVGPMTVAIHTDGSVGSPGIVSLAAACETGYQEAECPHHGFGAYGTTLNQDKSGYTGNGFIRSTEGSTQASSSKDQAAYHFTTKSGSHKAHFRVDTNARGDNDSWFYNIDGGPWLVMNNVSSLGLGWKWASTAAFNLSAGQHMIEVRNREKNLSLDRVALLPANSATPSGIGGTAHACGRSRAEVSCLSDSCKNGLVCCAPLLNEAVPVACQSTDECPLVSAGQVLQTSCDSHVDCDANELCVFVRFGNFENAHACVAKSEAVPFSGSTFMAPVCGSPGRASDPCPAPWGSCGAPSGPLGIRSCQLP